MHPKQEVGESGLKAEKLTSIQCTQRAADMNFSFNPGLLFFSCIVCWELKLKKLVTPPSLLNNYAITSLLGYYYGYSFLICFKYEESRSIYSANILYILFYIVWGKLCS